MTRQQLLREAKKFFVGAAVAVLVVFVVSTIGWRLKNDALILVSSFGGFFFVIGGVLGGLNFLLRGLLRSKDWRPSAKDWAMTGFDAESAGAKLLKLVNKELKGHGSRKPKLSHRRINIPPPSDPRGELRKFVESVSDVHVQHVMSCTAPFDERVVTVEVDVGRSLHEPMAHWVALSISAPCQVRVSEPLSWSKNDKTFVGDSKLATALNATPPISELLDCLVQSVYHDPTTIQRGDAGFALFPGSNGSSTAVAQTLPQERKGGFALHLGLTEFLAVLRHLEEVRAD